MQHTDDLKITPLGAGNEVGRSCIHVSYKSFELLLDCGVHPAFTGIGSLPFLDLVDLSKIDAIFITHFHLDHAGALPYLTEKTDFKGLVYMTHPTKAILRWLLNDYIRIINANSDIDFYTEDDLNNCYEKIVSIDYHQTVNLNNFRVTALNAGHVLGAAMFLIENDIFKLLYTGDYSTEADRHLKGADTSWIHKYEGDYILDILICESTYGVQCHLPREEREKRLTNIVSDIVTRGGKCLLPVFALGRAQELLLILEDFWEKNQRLQKIPIYYASALANRCLSVYQAYAHMMNLNIKKDAFSFKHIKNLKNIEDHLIKNACVIMASPGMLQSGLSRELFELFCEDSRNGTIIAGYCVQGTLAKEILNEPKEIISMAGNKLKLNMKVDYVSFSAHVDFAQNSSFIEQCRPKTVMLVHGEANEMARLKAAIEHNYHVETMKNGETHSVQIRRENIAVGMDLKDGPFSGIVVSDATGISLHSEKELRTTLLQRIRLPGLLQKLGNLGTGQYRDINDKGDKYNNESPGNIKAPSDEIFASEQKDKFQGPQLTEKSHQELKNYDTERKSTNTVKISETRDTIEQISYQETDDITNRTNMNIKNTNIKNTNENIQRSDGKGKYRESTNAVDIRQIHLGLIDKNSAKQSSKEDLWNITDKKHGSDLKSIQNKKETLYGKDQTDNKQVYSEDPETPIEHSDRSNVSEADAISEHKNNSERQRTHDINNITNSDSDITRIHTIERNINTQKIPHKPDVLNNFKINDQEDKNINSINKTNFRSMDRPKNGNEEIGPTDQTIQKHEISLENNNSSISSQNHKNIQTNISVSQIDEKIRNSSENFNQVKVKNTYNATPIFIKQLLLNQFPSIEIKGNTLYIQEIQVIFEDDIFLVYESGYINDMLACTIIRLIENITTRENVQLCKISKKAAIVKILNNYYDVVESDDNVEIIKNDKMVVLNEREIKGDPDLLEEVKKIIKKIVNIF